MTASPPRLLANLFFQFKLFFVCESFTRLESTSLRPPGDIDYHEACGFWPVVKSGQGVDRRLGEVRDASCETRRATVNLCGFGVSFGRCRGKRIASVTTKIVGSRTRNLDRHAWASESRLPGKSQQAPRRRADETQGLHSV